MSKLDDDLDQVKEDLATPPPEPGSRKKEIKKVAKKVTKTVVKTKGKSKGNGAEDEGKITLAALAAEAKITPAGARRKLRASDLEREGRWAWEEGSRALKEARKVLGLDA